MIVAIPDPRATVSAAPNPTTQTNLPAGDQTATSAGSTRVFDGTAEAPQPTLGTDRYELRESIAHGGMGEVFAAHDRTLRREVALKVLRDEHRDRPTVATRFVEEARITGQLQHPGVPPVHDLGILPDGRPFIAMKLIKGRTLDVLIARDKPDLSRLVAIFEQIAQTVAYAHAYRVIHRDLKPSNIMVGKFAEVQVMDWGLAKVLDEPGAMAGATADAQHLTAGLTGIDSDRAVGAETQAGSVMGTPAFMPPEQAIGAIDQIDARSDVFGLGAILCVMLTGQPPFVAATAESTRQLSARGKLDEAFDRLSKCGAAPELVGLCRQCLAPEKDERPANADKVAEAVSAFRAEAEERARRAELDRVRAEGDLHAAGIKAAEERKRRRVQLALAAAGVLLLVGGGAAAWWQDRQQSERRTERERLEQQRLTDLERVEAERKADTLRQQMEDEKRAQAESGRLSRNAQAVEALLVQCEDALRTSDPDRAAMLLAQIDKRFGEGGVEALKDRMDQCRADLAILRELDAVDDLIGQASENMRRVVSDAYAQVFKKLGIVLGTTKTAQAVQRINGSQIRERLLQGLNLWHLYYPTFHRPGSMRRIIDGADPDPFRVEVRDAFERNDASWYAALVEDEKAFRQPAWFAAVMGQASYFPTNAKDRILRAALEKSPSDFSLLLAMVTVHENSRESRSETLTQQFRWSQAAVAVRPRSKVAWRHLGRAYLDKGSLADSIRAYRVALRLDPDDVNSLMALSYALFRVHDPEAALELAQKAVASQPNSSWMHNQLGSIYDRMGQYADGMKCYEKAIEIDQQNEVENAAYFNNRGYSRLRFGDYDAAIQDFRDALRINKDFRLAETNLNYARELKAGGRDPEQAPPPREKKR